MSTLLGEHFATDENGSFLSWLESATRTASMAQTPITRKLRFRLRISHERSYGQSVLMKESTAFLILSWLSTPQSESGLESVTTYKNLGVYTNSIRLSWSSAFFNDGRDQHLTYSLAKFLPMVLHPLSYWSLQYNSIGIDIMLPTPPCFLLGCAVHWRVRKRPYNELHGHPCTGKAITTTMQVWGLVQNLHVHATKTPNTRSGLYLHTRSVLKLFLAHSTSSNSRPGLWTAETPTR